MKKSSSNANAFAGDMGRGQRYKNITGYPSVNRCGRVDTYFHSTDFWQDFAGLERSATFQDELVNLLLYWRSVLCKSYQLDRMRVSPSGNPPGPRLSDPLCVVSNQPFILPPENRYCSLTV